MSNLIPFEQAKLPAHLANMFGAANNGDLITGGGGFPTISIKGKVFHIKRGDEKTLITKPGEDDPASSIEVVIIKAGPAGNKTAKVFYTGGFVEGSEDKPLCYSNDGVAPASDAEEPQSSACATCPHNAWGSKISENGSKVKACSDSKRLAVAAVDQLNDPMMLRVPAASLKAMGQYAELLAKRGVSYQAVVTKIGFDYTVAHPALTFKPVGFIDEDQAVQVLEAMNSDVVGKITGAVESVRRSDAPQAVTKTAAKPAAKPAPQVDDLPAEPRTKVKVEAAEPVAPKVAPKAAPSVEDLPAEPRTKVKVEPAVTEGAAADMRAALDDLDFDN